MVLGLATTDAKRKNSIRRRIFQNHEITTVKSEYTNQQAAAEAGKLGADLAFAKGVMKNYNDKVGAVDNKLRARIARMEAQAEKTKPKGFQLRTMARAKRVAEEGKRRREAAAQAHATPVPTYAAKHERPFSCFFGKSESTNNIYLNGLAPDNRNSMLASNAGIRNFAVSQSHSNLRASPGRPVWA